MSTLFNAGYTMENAWEPTGNVERLSKEEIANIKSIKVRDTRLENGNTIKNVVFFLKNGKPVSHKLSVYNEQFPAGTEIDPRSVEFAEYKNDEGDTTITVTCEEA